MRDDTAKLESKTESFMQVRGENNGPQLTRGFAIDRTKGVLVLDTFSGQSRMLRFWDMEEKRDRAIQPLPALTLRDGGWRRTSRAETRDSRFPLAFT
jgi:hypothetical protein